MLWSTGRAGLATASYRELFAEPALRRLALADVCARLPQGMVSIALLLVAAQHASMTVAGLALLALLASALWRGPAGLVIGTAVLAGLLNPPLSPGLRAAAGAAPHGRGTETQAWINSIMNGGAAGGAAAVSAVITSILRPPRPRKTPPDTHGIGARTPARSARKKDSTGAERAGGYGPKEVRPCALGHRSACSTRRS